MRLFSESNKSPSLAFAILLWFPETPIWLIHWELSFLRLFTPASTLMAVLAAARDCFRTRAALQIEVLALRHQLNILRRSVKRPRLTAADRFLWTRLSRFWTGWRSALLIVKPETVIDWHRKGFRLFWTFKAMALKEDVERIAWIRQERWIQYGRAEVILQCLADLIEYPPRDRMPSLVI